MNELSLINKTMSSREIAELTGKEHKNVLRDCDILNETYERIPMPKIEQGYYMHERTGNQQHREMLLTKMQTFDLMTGYSIELRIKVNRRWEELESKSKLPDFNNPAVAARAWAEQYEQRELAEKKVQELTPKAKAYDTVLSSDTAISIGDAAAVLQLPYGRNTLFKTLREKQILMSDNVPYRKYIDAGYFKVIETSIARSGRTDVVLTTLITQRGIDYLFKILKIIN